MKKSILVVTACALVLSVATAHAATDEEKCLAGRGKAAAKYYGCVQKWLGKRSIPPSFDASVHASIGKCRIKYAAAWSKLQGLGTTCAVASRFTDNGDGTITDHLTALVWEKKSDDGSVHDKDTNRTWSTNGSPYAAVGTAFTNHLNVAASSLNVTGFAGSHDWRLPTLPELLTIALPEPYPCTTAPCFDPAFNSSCAPGCDVLTCSCPTLGLVWTGTESASDIARGWRVSEEIAVDGTKPASGPVRAVRGGL